MKTNIFSSQSSIQVLSLILCCAFLSCDKDPFATCRQIPTCEYFTCKVNGVRWEPYCKSDIIFGCTPWDVQYYRKSSGNLGMYLRNEVSRQGFVLLSRNEKVRIGENDLFINENLQTGYYDLNKSENCIKYNLDTLVPYSFYISRIDTINYFLSGTFHFIGKNDCGEEVNVTDGEFNLPYRF